MYEHDKIVLFFIRRSPTGFPYKIVTAYQFICNVEYGLTLSRFNRDIVSTSMGNAQKFFQRLVLMMFLHGKCHKTCTRGLLCNGPKTNKQVT